MKRFFFPVILLQMILLISAVSGQNAAQPSETTKELLAREIILPRRADGKAPASFRFDGTAGSLFQATLLRAKLPGGAVVSNCGQKEDKHFELSPVTTLGDIFKSIQTTDPDYRWELSNGVFNLLPANNTSKLLDLPVSEFVAENVTINEALLLLEAKPEVKAQKTASGLDKAVARLHLKGVYIPEAEYKNIPRYNFDLHGMTFREILNEIVRAQAKRNWKYEPHKTWVYVERNCPEQKEFLIYLAG